MKINKINMYIIIINYKNFKYYYAILLMLIKDFRIFFFDP